MFCSYYCHFQENFLLPVVMICDSKESSDMDKSFSNSKQNVLQIKSAVHSFNIRKQYNDPGVFDSTEGNHVADLPTSLFLSVHRPLTKFLLQQKTPDEAIMADASSPCLVRSRQTKTEGSVKQLCDDRSPVSLCWPQDAAQGSSYINSFQSGSL